MPDPADNLAIFPLKTVLVPGMGIPLRIFEDRYKQMLADCQRDEVGFGINLIRKGEEAGAAAQPCEVGTLATIHEHHELPNDESMLIAIGTGRYRILRITQEEPYLRAATAPVEDDGESVREDDPTARRLVEAATELFEELRDEDDDKVKLPSDPDALTWTLTARLPIDSGRRQSLLETTSVSSRITRLSQLIEQLMPEVRKRAQVQRAAKEIARTNGKASQLSS